MGRANWWLPGWLDRLLPHLSLESDLSEHQPHPAPVPVPRPGVEVGPASHEVEVTGATR